MVLCHVRQDGRRCILYVLDAPFMLVQYTGLIKLSSRAQVLPVRLIIALDSTVLKTEANGTQDPPAFALH